MGVSNRKLIEFSATILEFSLTPANDLVAFRLGSAAEAYRLEGAPKILIRHSDQREIGVIVEPRDLSNPPTAASAFLQQYESSIEEFVRSGQDLLVTDNGADFLKSAHSFAPGLIVIVLL